MSVDENTVAMRTTRALLEAKVEQQEREVERLQAQRDLRLMGVGERETQAATNG